jgi:uncharacterized SAM-binding protein YcdF (DUF218 family)
VSPGTDRRTGLARDLVVVALAGAIGVAAGVGYATWRIFDQGDRDEARPAGAIVVLGAAQYDGRPSPVFEARLDHAVDLYEAGLAPLLVTTGGRQPGDRWTEAETGKRYAMERGVPESAIVLENSGRSTLETIEGVERILHERGIEDAIFVSDRTHILRILRLASDAGIDGLGSPTTTSPLEGQRARQTDAALHELGALALYFLTGRGGTEDPADH